MSTKSIARHRRANMAKFCSMPHCQHKRHQSRSFCASHAHKASTLGHPNGTEVRFSEIKPWVAEAERIIEPFQDHPATVLVVGLLNDLLNGRQKLDDTRAAEYLTALRLANVDGRACLYRLCAIALIEHHNPRRFLHSSKYYHFALALSILKAVPRQRVYARSGNYRYKTIPGAVSSALADWIVKHTGVFLLRLVAHLSERSQQQSARLETLAGAFKPVDHKETN